MNEFLEYRVKLALRITTDALNTELSDTVAAALADLGLAGVSNLDTGDPLIIRAVVTFARMQMGSADDYDRLKRAYDEQKAQLRMATGYTDWEGTT